MERGRKLLAFWLLALLVSLTAAGCGRKDDGLVEEGVTEDGDAAGEDGEMVNEGPVDNDTNGMGSTGAPDGSGLVEETPDGDKVITDGVGGDSVMEDMEDAGEELTDGVKDAGEEPVDGVEDTVDGTAEEKK